MTSPAYDLRNEDEAKEYLNNIGVEFRFQCYHEKVPEGCHRLGDFLEGVRKDFAKAARVFQTNCDDSNYAHSCYKYGNYKVLGRGSEKNMEEALKYHIKGCEGGYMPACHNTGLIYGGGKVGKKDYKKAVEYFVKACNNKYQFGCYQASCVYIAGKEDVPKDMKLAFKYSMKACEFGNMYACANVSQMYRKGDGVEKNIQLSDKFKTQAKEMEDAVKIARRTLTFSE